MTDIRKLFLALLPGLFLTACIEPEYDNIWSISDLGLISTTGYCRDVHIVGDKAYVAAGAAGVQVWDFSNISQPVKTLNIDHFTPIYSAGFPSTFVYDRDIAQVYYSEINEDLFVLENGKQVKILNISDPDSIYTKGEILSDGTYGFCMPFESLDTVRIYAADNDDGLKWHTYVVASWGDWFQINGTEVSMIGNPTGIDYNDDYLAISMGQLGVELFTYDESSNNPVSRGKFDTDGIAGNPTLVGTDLYVACDFGGVTYFDLTDLPVDTTNSILSGHGYLFAEDLNVDHVTIDDDMAVLSLGPSGIALFDISNPKKPESRGIFDVGYTYKTMIYNELVFVSTREGLSIIEIDK